MHPRLTGRDQPVRERRREFRRRVPRRFPARLDLLLIARLITAAVSWRDKTILTLLCRTGQRIGDWSDVNGRHGLLGMALSDVDERNQTITVRLKGARQEHRVPVTDDFWPLFRRYLKTERRPPARTTAAWVAQRRGHGVQTRSVVLGARPHGWFGFLGSEGRTHGDSQWKIFKRS